MKIRDLRLAGIRCFEDTGDIPFDPKCNILVGKNNAGKSTVLKAIVGLQSFPFDNVDVRPGHQNSSFVTLCFNDMLHTDVMNFGRPKNQEPFRVFISTHGVHPPYSDAEHYHLHSAASMFPANRPQHMIVPFLAKRKAVSFDHNVSLGPQSTLTGTMSSLYGRIDVLATSGHPDHGLFLEAVEQIIGLPITTQASTGGKVAGFYFDRDTFVTLDRMGDGVSEMVALIVEP